MSRTPAPPLPKTKSQVKLAKVQTKIRKLQGKPELKPVKTMYSEIMAKIILESLAEGKPLSVICRPEGMPSPGTILAWVNNPDESTRPGFAEAFMRCRELGYHVMADDMLAIADDSSRDRVKTIVNGKIIERFDFDHIQRDRLKVDTRKFILSKALPKIYGDSIRVEHTGAVNLNTRMDAARTRLQEAKKKMEEAKEELTEAEAVENTIDVSAEIDA